MENYYNPFKRDVDLSVGKVMKAVMQNSVEALQKAISERADIENSRTDKTPLMLAIIENKTDLVPILVQNGANIDAKNRSGFTVLQAAIQGHHNEAVSLMIGKKVRLETKDADEDTPLITSIKSKNYTAMKWLLEAGASVNNRKQNSGTLVELFEEANDYKNNKENPVLADAYKILKSYQSEAVVAPAASIILSSADSYKISHPSIPLEEEAEVIKPKVSIIKKKNG